MHKDSNIDIGCSLFGAQNKEAIDLILNRYLRKNKKGAHNRSPFLRLVSKRLFFHKFLSTQTGTGLYLHDIHACCHF